MALYNSTQGENWINNSGWNTSSPICTWYGVTCDSFGNVTNLVLDQNGLDGAIPPEIGKRVNLQVLDLSWNLSLSGSIPPEIGKLVSLQSLNLS